MRGENLLECDEHVDYSTLADNRNQNFKNFPLLIANRNQNL